MQSRQAVIAGGAVGAGGDPGLDLGGVDRIQLAVDQRLQPQGIVAVVAHVRPSFTSCSRRQASPSWTRALARRDITDPTGAEVTSAIWR